MSKKPTKPAKASPAEIESCRQEFLRALAASEEAKRKELQSQRDLGESLWQLRSGVDLVTFRRLIAPIVTAQFATRCIDLYLASKQNPETRCPSGTEIGTQEPACQGGGR